jgi:leader peptidase (prepilin peptidase) / N-methyltransferase
LPLFICMAIYIHIFLEVNGLFEANFFSTAFFQVHIIVVFMFGMIFGSFLNVCIYRIPAGLSITLPGSHCFSCGTPIKWYDNIPVFSYLILRGRCRYCGTAFSPRYLFIEIFTGVLFALTFYRFQYTLATPVYITFVCLLIVATFTDIDHWIIPDGVSIGGAIFGVCAAIIAGFAPKGFIVAASWPFTGNAFYHPFLNSVIGALLGAGSLYMIGFIGTFVFRKDAMGFGDVKLFLLIGAFLGALNCFFVITIASMIGSVLGGAMLLIHKYKTSSVDVEPVKDSDVENDQEELSVNAAEEICKKCEQPDEENEDTENPEEREKRVISKILGISGIHSEEEDQLRRPALHHIPFGPYIAMAALIILIWGDWIVNKFLYDMMMY